MPSKLTVGLVQMSMTADPEANLRKAIARVKEAASKGAKLVCLPELFRTLYIGQREDHELF
ncbi:MAG: acyltransferase, partial [Gemmatimonadetes bacterium]|nr:acyltransferase [Gemmatimonadota bacterium]